MKTYRADPRINASKLKLFAGDFFEPMNAINGLKNPMVPSDAMKLGTLVHAIVEHKGALSLVTKDIPISPYKDFRKKEAQIWKKENPDYMTEELLEKASIMAQRIMDITPECLGEDARMEIDYYTDEYKALLDCVIGDHGFDWKTTSATNARQWERDANNYHYALQAYHYKTVAELEEFSFVAVSSIAPYPVWRFKCTPEYLAYGKYLWDKALERYNKYKDAEITVDHTEIALSAPNWFQPEEEAPKDKSFTWA